MNLLDLPLLELQQRRSAKWTTYASDVLPLPIAEMDVALAPQIATALHEAIDHGDTGYHGDSTAVRQAFAAFASRRFGWSIDPEHMRTCPDVAVGAVEILRRALRPGDSVIVTPPAYPPFDEWLDESALRRVDVRLDEQRGWRLDLDGIDKALGAGARAVLLCNPHNPTGTVHPREDLHALAALADDHNALVLADEIHAPLVHHPDAVFTPFLSIGDNARRTGIALHSASKAWNLAGLKCALAVADCPERTALLRALPDEVTWGTGHLGALATEVAYGGTDDWLDGLLVALDLRARQLASLLARDVPQVAYRQPEATYLAWLDVRSLGLGEDPADRLLREARVAVSDGRDFGSAGTGFLRLNFACSETVLTEAVQRIATIASSNER